jgi:hypothetical protein
MSEAVALVTAADLALSVMRACMRLVTAVSRTRESPSSSELHAGLVTVIERLDEMDVLVRDHNSSTISSLMPSISSLLEEIRALLKRIDGRRSLVSGYHKNDRAWPFKERENQRILAFIDSFGSELTFMLNVARLSMVDQRLDLR